MPIELTTISASRIKTFDHCLFKYYLQYHTDLPRGSNFGAQNGSLVHNILEQYATKKDAHWLERLLKGYNGTLSISDRDGNSEIMESPLTYAKASTAKNMQERYHNLVPDCDNCIFKGKNICKISREPLDKLTGCPKKLFQDTEKMIKEAIIRYEDIWSKILKDDSGNYIGIEYPFHIEVANTGVAMNGFMDLVYEEDQYTIHIVDYKAGTWIQTYEKCMQDIQARMYSLAGRKEFIEKLGYKNIILTFDYFQGQPITVAFSLEQDLSTENYLINKIKEIQSVSEINRIVSCDEELGVGEFWQCKAICAPELCKKMWKGKFNI